jgi:heat shock protein HtpX
MAFTFDEVKKNNIKTAALFGVFFAFILALSIILGSVLGNIGTSLLLGIVFLIIYTAYITSQGRNVALNAANAYKADPAKFKDLHDIVEEMSIAAGVPKPDVYIIPSKAMNAFATGKNPEEAAVAVTEGMLQSFTRNELTGVVAHEIAHIENRDTKTMLYAALLAGFAVLLSDFFLRSLFFSGDTRKNPWLIVVGIALAIFAPISAELIKLAISRKREYAADAEAAQYTRNPSWLADALQRLKGDREEVETNKAINHLYISEPQKSWFGNLFSTHPPLDERIQRLNEL